jgi:hypothetical protein
MPFDASQPQYFTHNKVTFGRQDAVGLPAGTTLDRPGTPNPGDIRFNTLLNSLETYDVINLWQPIRIPGTATITKDTDTGDGSTTAFNMLSSTPDSEENVLIFINNIFQEATTAYTVSGTTVTFTSAPPNAHVIVALSGFDTV